MDMQAAVRAKSAWASLLKPNFTPEVSTTLTPSNIEVVNGLALPNQPCGGGEGQAEVEHGHCGSSCWQQCIFPQHEKVR